jgi:hypothetical protein
MMPITACAHEARKGGGRGGRWTGAAGTVASLSGIETCGAAQQLGQIPGEGCASEHWPIKRVKPPLKALGPAGSKSTEKVWDTPPLLPFPPTCMMVARMGAMRASDGASWVMAAVSHCSTLSKLPGLTSVRAEVIDFGVMVLTDWCRGQTGAARARWGMGRGFIDATKWPAAGIEGLRGST